MNKKVPLREREAYHTLRSKCPLCCCVSWWGVPPSSPEGGYTHPVLTGGTPSSSNGGSTPSSPNRGTIGYPHQLDGVPPSARWRYPSPSAGWGYFPVSQMELPPLTRWGYPAIGWMGVPPSAGWGTLYWPDGGTPIGWMGVPPEMWTDRHLWKQYLPHSFGIRAVTNLKMVPCGNNSVLADWEVRGTCASLDQSFHLFLDWRKSRGSTLL